MSTLQIQKKLVGYILFMLPYIHVDMNMLCNPDDVFLRDKSKVRPITFGEFCSMSAVDYSEEHIKKLYNALRSLRVPVDGNLSKFYEPLCLFVRSPDSDNIKDDTVLINPRVVFRGRVERCSDELTQLFWHEGRNKDDKLQSALFEMAVSG